jgi:hypothetical protein
VYAGFEMGEYDNLLGLILRSAPKERISKDGAAAWFETTRGACHRAALRADPLARLLTMRRRKAGQSDEDRN